jgi:hypothetical protein
MSTNTKITKGSLLDISTRNVLVDVSIEITLSQPSNPNDKPSYQGIMTIKGYRPEYDNKAYLLKIGDQLIGEVFIHIVGIPDMTKTSFSVNFVDAAWKNIDWFKNL